MEMKKRLTWIIWPVALCLAACSGETEQGPDGGSDGGSDAGAFEPYAPPVPDNPYVDRVYLQEFNHTSNELEPGVGPLIAALVPPAGQPGFETPSLIGPRGLIRHAQDGSMEQISIAGQDPDLLGAAISSRGLFLAGPQRLYHLEQDGLTPTDAPASVTLTGLAPGASNVYLLTDAGTGVVDANGQVHWPASALPTTAALETPEGLFAGGDGWIAGHPVPVDGLPAASQWTLDAASGLSVGRVVAFVSDISLPAELDLVVIGDQGLQAFSLDSGAPVAVQVVEFAADRFPLTDPTGAAKTADGGFVVATRGGAYRIMERGIGPEWRVYNAERWLTDEDVHAVACDPDVLDGPIWFATAGGLSYVTAQRMTLEEKLTAFVDRVVQRHDRDGAVADSRLSVRGDLSTSIPYDSDNDGGWTCYWILAECFRWKVTGDPQAKVHFDKSLERMLSFRTLTGTDHFLARAVIRKEGCVLDDCNGPDDGEWFTSPDGEWWVKADTSNDEVTSHMFMMGHAYDVCADEDQRTAIAAHVDGIIGGIVDNGYRLVDLDGEVTSYGQFDPSYVNEPLLGQLADGGRRSVQMLAAIDLAYYMTGKQKYLDAKRELIEEHHYDVNVVHECEAPLRQGTRSGDGNELGTQAFFVLLRYEQDPALREMWLSGWRNTYSNILPQQGALWDITNGVLGGDDPQFDNTGRWLRLAPMDMIRWNQHNSHRQDLAPAPDFYADDARIRSDGRILPYDERRCDRWNTDQYRVDGGMGAWTEMDGADVLMPYWTGRYYGFIVPAD